MVARCLYMEVESTLLARLQFFLTWILLPLQPYLLISNRRMMFTNISLKHVQIRAVLMSLNRLIWNGTSINSLRLSDAYMRQKTRPPLLKIMACRLIGAKPLFEPMLEYCQLDIRNIIQWNVIFLSRKCVWKCRLENGGHFARPQCANYVGLCLGRRPCTNRRSMIQVKKKNIRRKSTWTVYAVIYVGNDVTVPVNSMTSQMDNKVKQRT